MNNLTWKDILKEQISAKLKAYNEVMRELLYGDMLPKGTYILPPFVNESNLDSHIASEIANAKDGSQWNSPDIDHKLSAKELLSRLEKIRDME